jgi:colicin import membrane protein
LWRNRRHRSGDKGQKTTAVAVKDLFNASRPGLWVSSLAHAALIAAALATLSAEQFPDTHEGIPVEIFSDARFSEITKGETEAKRVETAAKPRADRVAERVEQRNPGEDKRDAPAPPTRPPEARVAETEPSPAAPPLPPPAPSREDPRAEEAARLAEKARAEEERAAQKAEAEASVRREAARADADAVAAREKDAKAKADAELQAKVKAGSDAKAEAEAKRAADAKAKAETDARARREAELSKRLDLGDLREFLNSKEKNQSTGATGAEIQRTAALGIPTGTAARLNPSLRDALAGLLKEQMRRCYSAPVGASTGTVTIPMLDVSFNADGSLAGEPRIIKSGSSILDRSVAETALRAVRRCAPYNIPAKFAPYYADWKRWHIEFDVES